MTSKYLTNEVFKPRIRQYMIDTASGFSKEKEAQKILIVHGWIRIAECDEGKTDEYYMKRAFMQMYKVYEEKLRAFNYIPRYPSDDKAVRRVGRKIIKYFPKTGGETVPKRPMHNREG